MRKKMRKIPYIKKRTTANTEYRQTARTDTRWVIDQCKRLVEVAQACVKNGIIEGAALNAPNPKMPRMSSGNRNSASTMCEGVVENFNQGQYDLSNKQCDGLEEAFRIGSNVIEDFEEVIFEEVTSLPKLQSSKAPVPETCNSVFSDLFDVGQ